MVTLSKSKLHAYRQCEKRLWLEVHRPELRLDTNQTEPQFQAGHRVGEIARELYDPKGKGILITFDPMTLSDDIVKTAKFLASSQPIFKGGFLAGGVRAFADVLLPVRKGGSPAWRLIEVKSSASVKDYHRDDVAVQAFTMRKAGVNVSSVAVAHIDSAWTYPGEDDYNGLFIEKDLTDEALAREKEVLGWIDEARRIVGRKKEPSIKTGEHCDNPCECSFKSYCSAQEAQPKYPVSLLPRIQAKALKAYIEDKKISDMRDVPDKLLNDIQRRVKKHTLNKKVYFDAKGAATDLAPYPLPDYFLDFETIQFKVPIWKGTRPFQQIPFQFSLHRVSRDGSVKHKSFLDLSGNDPSKVLVEELISACGERGPIFAYNAGFEVMCIRELASRFPRLKRSLLALSDRIVDLLKIARQRYYHPAQQGSWSIKWVLPTIADLRHDALKGVQDGGMAMEAYLEAIAPETPSARKKQIERELLAYCELDTQALVRLWRFFGNRS